VRVEEGSTGLRWRSKVEVCRGGGQPSIGTTGGSEESTDTAACHFMSGRPERVVETSNSLYPTGLAAGRNSCTQCGIFTHTQAWVLNTCGLTNAFIRHPTYAVVKGLCGSLEQHACTLLVLPCDSKMIMAGISSSNQAPLDR